MKKVRTPQEKKALSYAKDCRNHYGESDKGSRKAIRKNKSIQNQVLRRKINQELRPDTTTETSDLIDAKVKSIKRGNWKKSSDISLGLFVQLQKDMRKRREGRKLRGILKGSKLDTNVLSELRKRK